MPVLKKLSVAVVFGMTMGGAALVAQAPVVNVIRPVGVQPGQTVDVRTIGGNLAGAKECWTSFGGKVPLPTDVENNGTDNGQTLYHVAVPADAQYGVHGLRVTTDKGVSGLRLLLVDDLPTVLEAGGNNALGAAQEIAVPAGVEGTVDNLARDYFRFTAQAGQTLTFEVWARRLGSPLDPVMFLYRADGKQLEYADDSPGLSSDSQIVHTFAETSQYVVEIRDNQYQGGGNHFYRLRVGEFPALNSPLPAGVTRSVEARIDFAGRDAANTVPFVVNIPADNPAAWWRVAAQRVGGQQRAFGIVEVSANPEFLEREPNDATEQANRIEAVANLNGRSERRGDVDRFVFAAKAGERFDFRGVTRDLGSPIDLNLRLLKADGSQVAAVDDAGATDSVFSPAIPTDGDYVLEVRDLNHRGGPEFAYRVVMARYAPGFALEAGMDGLSLAAGNVLAVPVTVARADYGGEIAIGVEGLPAGVTATPTVIGPGLNSTVLTLEAAPEYAVGSLEHVRIVGTAKIGEAEVKQVASVRTALRGQWNNSNFYVGPLAESVAIAGAPAQLLRLRVEPHEVQFKRGEKPTIKLIAVRGEGVDEAITVATNPDKNAFPANTNLVLKNIDKGQTEVELQFDSNANTPLGAFSVVLTATHKKGDVTIIVSSPAITYRVVE